MVEYEYYWLVSFVNMIDKTDLFLYGGAIIAGALVIFLGYRLFRKNGEGKPKNQVMNKIQDFYSAQNKADKDANINY